MLVLLNTSTKLMLRENRCPCIGADLEKMSCTPKCDQFFSMSQLSIHCKFRKNFFISLGDMVQSKPTLNAALVGEQNNRKGPYSEVCFNTKCINVGTHIFCININAKCRKNIILQ